MLLCRKLKQDVPNDAVMNAVNETLLGGICMPRPIVVGNGRVLITFDDDYAMRDLYYPHVGMLNQLCGHKNSLGVWVDDTFSWVEQGPWRCELLYEEDTLISAVELTNDALGLRIHCADAVHF